MSCKCCFRCPCHFMQQNSTRRDFCLKWALPSKNSNQFWNLMRKSNECPPFALFHADPCCERRKSILSWTTDFHQRWEFVAWNHHRHLSRCRHWFASQWSWHKHLLICRYSVFPKKKKKGAWFARKYSCIDLHKEKYRKRSTEKRRPLEKLRPLYRESLPQPRTFFSFTLLCSKGDSTAAEYFTIDDSAEIKLARNLDFEAVQQHVLKVVADDGTTTVSWNKLRPEADVFTWSPSSSRWTPPAPQKS